MTGLEDREKIFASLVKEFGFPLLSAELISGRIENISQAAFYSDRTIAGLFSPFLFSSMKECVARLDEAIAHRRTVMIFSDKDADGLCSLSLMNGFLKAKGLKPVLRIAEGDEGYGISDRVVLEAKELGVSLILLLDCGCSQKKQVALIRDLGMGALVLDHHLAPSQTRPDCPMVNPKDESSGYPFIHLSACGTCAKTIWAYEFSKLAEYDNKFFFLDVRSSRDGIVLESASMQNFILSSPRTESFRDLSRFLNSESFEKMQKARVFAFEDSQMLRSLAKSLSVCILKNELLRAFPGLPSGGLSASFEAFKGTVMAQSRIEVLSWLYKRLFLKRNPSVGRDWAGCLDLVAISTIADMVPMTGENLILTDLGLKVLNKRKRKSLLGVLSAKGLAETEADERDVAFQIAPVINAPWRMERADVALHMLSEDDANLIDAYTREAVDLNENRKRLCQRFLEEFRQDALKSLSDANGVLASVISNDLPHGLTGILSNALKAELMCSTLVISGKGGRFSGSLRTDEKAVEVLAQVKGFLSDYGGHFCAAGFSLKDGKSVLPFINSIRQTLASFFNQKSANSDTASFDAQVFCQSLPQDMLSQVAFLAPFGVGNEPPRIMIRGINPSVFSVVKGKVLPHLQAIVSDGRQKICCVFWQKGSLLGSLRLQKSVDLLVKMRGKRRFRQRVERYFEILAAYDDCGHELS